MIVGHIGGSDSEIDTGDIQKSLRFRSRSSAYLSRTDTNNSTSQRATFSCWLKRGDISGNFRALHTIVYDVNNRYLLSLDTSGGVSLYGISGSVAAYYKISSSLLRDPSSHFHLVVAYDSTLADAEDRIKLFVNGGRITSFPTVNTNPAQNAVIWQSNTVWSHRIGQDSLSGYYLDGYLSRVCFVDGQALTPAAFGYLNTEINAWVTKSRSQVKAVVDAGGTNSFMLDFDNGSNLTTLGYDKSTKGNNWTANNISLTSGITYDWMDDTPTNNYCTMNPLAGDPLATLTNGNLTVLGGDNNGNSRYGSIGVISGKWYFEFTYTKSGTGGALIGVTSNIQQTTALTGVRAYYSNGNKYSDATASAYGATFTQGDVVGVALDMDAGTLLFYKNGVSLGQAFSGLSGQYFPLGRASTVSGSEAISDLNFGQRPFAYTPPAGFKALCTKNLPTPSILNPKNHFDVKLHVGNAASQKVTSDFKPGLVWIKRRNISATHSLFDEIRGATVSLHSETTGADDSSTSLNSLDADGFTLGNNANTNSSNDTFVDWLWKAGGAAVTNNAGSIQSQVSANPQAGFSIVTYTGTGANATVGHGLGVAPKMVIVKNRVTSTINWRVQHESLGATKVTYLSSTAAATVDSNQWNNTAPTSSVFSVGSDLGVNGNLGGIVAYCFAEVPGFSKFGSYTGNGNANGPFVYCGFRPKYVLIKRTDNSVEGDWIIADSARSQYNLSDANLFANLSQAESSALFQVDFTANGFKIRTSTFGNRASPYIFMAFAEAPFKYANAR